MLLSPVSGQQFVLEVPPPRNIDKQKRVKTRQPKPQSDEAEYIFGSSLSVYNIGQESYVNFHDEKENMLTRVYDRLPSAACCYGGEKMQHFQVQIFNWSSQKL